MIDELEIAYMSFYASYAVIMELDTKKHAGGKRGVIMESSYEYQQKKRK